MPSVSQRPWRQKMRRSLSPPPAHHLRAERRQRQQAANAQECRRSPHGTGHSHSGHILGIVLAGHGRIREVHACLRKLGNEDGQPDGVKRRASAQEKNERIIRYPDAKKAVAR